MLDCNDEEETNHVTYKHEPPRYRLLEIIDCHYLDAIIQSPIDVDYVR